MDILDLAVKKRELTGTRRVRGLRREGRVPGVLYGHGVTPVAFEVKAADLKQALHTKAGENVILNLSLEGVKLEESTCIIKDIQHHPVTGNIEHVDFTLISLKEKIEVNIPVVIRNAEEAAGVKEGGVLDVVHHEIRVECLPTQIPENILLDIKELKIGDAIHVRDLPVPEGVTFLIDPEEVMVTVHHPVKEEEKPAEGEEVTEPEVIEKGKKEAPEEGTEEPKKPAEAKKPEAKKEG